MHKPKPKPKRNWKLRLFYLVSLSVFLGLFLSSWWRADSDERPPPEQKSAAPGAEARAVVPNAAALEALVEANRVRLETVRKQRQDTRHAPDQLVEGFSAAAIEGLIDTAWVIHEARNMFNRQELQEREYRNIGADPAKVALAQAIAADAELAQAIYGDEQAFARTYAVRAIGYLATHGRPELAAATIDRLGQKLNTADAWKKGVERDYVDLIASYTRALGRDAVMGDLDAFLSRIHFTARTNDEASRGLWDSGLLRQLDAAAIQALAAAIDRRMVGVSASPTSP